MKRIKANRNRTDLLSQHIYSFSKGIHSPRQCIHLLSQRIHTPRQHSKILRHLKQFARQNPRAQFFQQRRVVVERLHYFPNIHCHLLFTACAPL